VALTKNVIEHKCFILQ